MVSIPDRSQFELSLGRGSIRQWISFLISLSQPVRQFDAVESDLERLAETSPHLLADLGFQRDPARSSEEQEVWVRGERRFALRRQPFHHGAGRG